MRTETPRPSASTGASNTDALLHGPILPLLLRFSLPNMVAMLAIALAAMAETAYVGQLGAGALAGMALVFPFVMLQNMLSAGAMGGGVSSAVSRALGAGDAAGANALAVHALWIGVAAGTAFMLLMECFGHTFMGLLGGRDEALAQAVAYCEVAFTGSVFLWVVNTLSSVIRGSGNMRVPSVTLLLVALAQVVLGGALGLGWLAWPALGMRGVAAGGVLANALGAAFLWTYLARGQGHVRLNIRSTPLVRKHLLDILRVGAVACISPLQTVLTILILTRLVSSFGTQALAGYGIGTRLEFLLVPIAFAVGVASVPLVGMAIGAGDTARARKAAWTAAALATALLGTLGLQQAAVVPMKTAAAVHVVKPGAVRRAVRRPGDGGSHGWRSGLWRRHKALRLVGAFAEEMLFHLAGQVLAGALVGQVQAVFIDQHGLVLEPLGPGLLAHALINALAQLAGVGREVQTFGFGAEFDALNGACHGDSALIYLKKRRLYRYKISVFPVLKLSPDNRCRPASRGTVCPARSPL